MNNPKKAPNIDVATAYKNIVETGLVKEPGFAFDENLSGYFDAEIILVSDMHQETGAYKERGAHNFVIEQALGHGYKTLVTPSAGNKAAAVARVAKIHGFASAEFLPEGTPDCKIQNILRCGDEKTQIHVGGETVDDAINRALNFVQQSDGEAIFVPPFDHPDVAAGQGTLTASLLQEHPDTEVILVPVGGGGLLAGTLAAVEQYNSNAHVIGVEPDGAASLAYNLALPDHDLPDLDKFVEGAAVKRVGRLVLDLLHSTDEDRYNIVRSANQDIQKATTYLWENSRFDQNPELAAALSVSALSLEGIQRTIQGKKVACLLTGRNLDQDRFEREIKTDVPFLMNSHDALVTA
jgi:threonine dehydratase